MTGAVVPPDLIALYILPLLGLGLLILGLLILLVAWLPLVRVKASLSLPIRCVTAGTAIFSFDRFAPDALHPIERLLASDVQVEGPKSDRDDTARFALTSDAGFADEAERLISIVLLDRKRSAAT